MARLAYRFLLIAISIWISAAQPVLVEIKRAAEQGDAAAQKQLAQNYHSKFQFSEAEYWYKKAAHAGDPDVLLALASYYAGGKPQMSGFSVVRANRADAIALYGLAAAQGHNRAQHDLAIQYYNGTIVARNKMEAYRLFRLSGMLSGRVYLERLILEMSTTEIDQAEREVKAFTPKTFQTAFRELIESDLKLNGIIRTNKKSLALVNSQTVEEGQSFQINVATISVVVRCDQIAQNAVHLSFYGRTVVITLK